MSVYKRGDAKADEEPEKKKKDIGDEIGASAGLSPPRILLSAHASRLPRLKSRLS